MKRLLYAVVVFSIFIACKEERKEIIEEVPVKTDSIATHVEPVKNLPFSWEAANIYFLLTDRFNNGTTENDLNYDRTEPTGPLRGFMGGDIQGITQKIEEGYFSDLGINAIWFTPVVEQVHGSTDEGTGNTYAYHGYWTKDWTALDPNFGTRKDLEKMVKAAHKHGIRVLMDVVLNHTGPVTDKDEAWPEEWIRTSPTCDFTSYETTVECTLVENLPDVRTESNEAVELPDALLAKWKEEGRLSQELDELQLFFERTGYPRAPRYYIIKWLTDYVNHLGIDGFRVDTVKHVNENAWSELYKEASFAFENWKKMHPDKVLDDQPFYMVGEVYNYGISNGREFDFKDKKVDYFAHGFKSLINFELKEDAKKDYESIFRKYDKILRSQLNGKSVVNYLTSHDDGHPYDIERKDPIRAANILMLTPGASQIYYGDETARSLTVTGTEDTPVQGDASLRSFMNWEELDSLPKTKEIFEHWKKLGTFRRKHLAVGAGIHKRLGKSPYVFSRSYSEGDIKDKVVIGLDLPKGKKSLWVKGFFGDGTKLYDTYSDTEVVVQNGKVILENDYNIALLEHKE
ncbi:alpha-amylase family glycosyl hydrolase [Zobellia galactanivorans]|uniref:Alpha-amylase n=1 Tax=Zobellia galactanivorans (strain DSM 12802 / CCUG 47099 / CIP 106680 / NCIMB 13871 / Dsij) TaxID=63186 RepID=G0LCY3_ZOBGA|nr:alpha-amylase family glycosyl hydrolase [Zobellia galactanivorans]CAZ94115.1 Alpha-amylase, family GH13 [Zobellia galactanivorans]